MHLIPYRQASSAYNITICHLSYTHTGNFEEVPELFLSLHLHLHHCCLCGFYVSHRPLQLREQINDATLTHQNCTTEKEKDENIHKSHTERTVKWHLSCAELCMIVCTSGECISLWAPCPGSELFGVLSSPCRSCHCSHVEGQDLYENILLLSSKHYSLTQTHTTHHLAFPFHRYAEELIWAMGPPVVHLVNHSVHIFSQHIYLLYNWIVAIATSIIKFLSTLSGNEEIKEAP